MYSAQSGLCAFYGKATVFMLHISFNNGILKIKFASVSVFLKQIFVSSVEHIRKTEETTHKLL